MKKLIAIIILLFIVFISMLIYRNNEKENEVKIDEITKIENYINKIYGWKEVTNEAIPNFDDINNADEKWLWGTVRENIEEYEISYENIEKIERELFGDDLKKNFPKEGNEFIKYNAEKGGYEIQDIVLDALKDSYLIDKIEKNKENYKIEIIEFLVDYTESDNGKVVIRNTNNDKISELIVEETNDSRIKKIVKDNKEKFNKKSIEIAKKDDNIFVKKVE